MDDSLLDARLIEKIQSGFPLLARPYLALAELLGTTEEKVIQRLRALQDAGTIREIGPVFELRRVGYTSTLCAAKVAPKHLDTVAEFINRYPEATHNYARNHAFNLWFTLIAPSGERIEQILQAVREQQGVAEAHSMPATRTFKIKVHFNTAGDDA